MERELTAEEREELRGYREHSNRAIRGAVGWSVLAAFNVFLLVRGERHGWTIVLLVLSVAFAWLSYMLYRGGLQIAKMIDEQLAAGPVRVTLTRRSSGNVDEKIKGVGLAWVIDGKPAGWRVLARRSAGKS